jgi:hypothetical protein
MSRFFNSLKPRIQSAIAVVAYPDNFEEMINLAVRLDNSFRRLKHAQEKPGKGVRNLSHKKKGSRGEGLASKRRVQKKKKRSV